LVAGSGTCSAGSGLACVNPQPAKVKAEATVGSARAVAGWGSMVANAKAEATEGTFVAGFEIESKGHSIALILSLFESGDICWEFITPDSDTATAVRNSPGTAIFCFTTFISDARLELLTSNGVEQQHATHTNDPGDDGKGWKQYTSKLWHAFLRDLLPDSR
jgi:hypothetical protein